MEEIKIRVATIKDAKGFLDLVTALAAYEKLEPPDQAAKERLVTDVFRKRRLNLFVAVSNGRHVGYALFFYTYSSFLARQTLYLEDLFVLSEYRGKGVGKQLFMRCVKEAVKRGCGRMEWAVLTWNNGAIRFYEQLGANRLDEWYFYRLTSESMHKLLTSFE